MIGETIGNYRVTRKLGEGGMGAVFEAINEQLGRRVAIKVLHPEFSQREDMATRFFNEARAVNIIKHPGIVDISEYGRLPSGMFFIVMEYLEGDSLGRHLKQAGQMVPAAALYLVQQMALSLMAAHEKGIIHRDLKPDNVMLVPDPHSPGAFRPKILDFGIAKVLAPAGQAGLGAQFKTKTGTLMGTPIYMSPEQCRGSGAPDHKSDVYSLGVMLYQMLAGRPPFVAEGVGELIAMHMFVEPRSLKQINPSISDGVAQMVGRMMDKTPQGRPEMAEVAAELLRLLPLETGRPTSPDAWKDGSHPSLPVGLYASPPSTLGAGAGERGGLAKKPAALLGLGALVLLVAVAVLLGQKGPGPRIGPQQIERAPADPDAEAARLLFDVDSELLAKRWFEAGEKIDRVLKLPGVSQRVQSTALAKKKQAELEDHAREIYGRFSLAAVDGKYESAMTEYREIPAASVYRQLARERYEQIFPPFAQEHMRKAERARQAGDCDTFQVLTQTVLAVDPNYNPALSEKAKSCVQAARVKSH